MQTAKYKTRRQADLGKVKRLVGVVVAGKESDGAWAGIEWLFGRQIDSSTITSNSLFPQPTTPDIDVDPSSPQRASKKKGKKAKKG